MERPHDFDYLRDDSDGNQQNGDISEEEDSYSSDSECEIETYSCCRNARESDVGQLVKQIRQLEKQSRDELDDDELTKQS